MRLLTAPDTEPTDSAEPETSGAAPMDAADLAGTPARAGVQIAGWGTAVPGRRVTNHDLARYLDTSDEWIVERSGIRERRWAGPGETTGSLGLAAARDALADAEVAAADVDVVVVATSTPDNPMPSTGSQIAHALGITAGAFDVNAACAGFVYALTTASGLVSSGVARTALVVGSDTMSTIVDPQDRATAVLFGDGAGALVLTSGRTPGAAGLAPAVPAAPSTPASASPAAGPAGLAGLVASDLVGDPAGVDLLVVPAGGSARPASAESVAARDHFLRMDGREVFRRAVRAVTASIGRTLDRAGCTPDDVALFVPHQANARIVDAVLSRTGLAPERTSSTIDRYGNTSAGSIPIALAEAADAGTVAPGDLVLMCGFGAGLSVGTALWRWGTPTRLSRGDT
ncbi:MAG TPA: beta-ketoacyl-ACP synthase III [Acidimicrobiales bacterium]|nr:beta-ketoacyl-ACP synthase III [Acidimicrobiales bacterium]